MTTATHRRRPADANDHRGRLSAGTLRGFQCGRIRLTQLAAAPTHRIHRLSRRQRPGRFAGWITGTCFVIALIVTVVAAVLQRTNVVQPLNTLRMVWIQVAGIIPATAGIAATVYAQLAMGDSWRIGVDEQENTTLVRTGPFKWVRHPIYTAMMAFGLGLLLVTRISLPSPGLSCSLPRSRCMSAASKNPTCCGRTVPSTAATPPASAGSSRVWG